MMVLVVLLIGSSEKVDNGVGGGNGNGSFRSIVREG